MNKKNPQRVVAMYIVVVWCTVYAEDGMCIEKLKIKRIQHPRPFEPAVEFHFSLCIPVYTIQHSLCIYKST